MEARRTKKAKKSAPSETVGNGRGPGGRFAPGNPGGPGRPKGYDFRLIVTDHLAETGETVEDVISEAFANLRAIGKGGDAAAVAANKLIIERLCESDATKLEIGNPGAFDGPPVPVAADLAAGIQKLAELGHELLKS